jgi:PHD/YefM family antitoxin component YafN of YafNO toxin-antitoxin module
MKEVSAAVLRQAMGKVAKRLERTGEPLLLELGNKAVGVLVSVKDFEEHFALHDAAARRRALMDEILADRVATKAGVDQALEASGFACSAPKRSCSTARSRSRRSCASLGTMPFTSRMRRRWACPGSRQIGAYCAV